jgi:tetratricopeptide (TPR) repeat protein
MRKARSLSVQAIHRQLFAALLACLLATPAAPLRAETSECPDLSALQPTRAANSPRTAAQREADRIVADAQAAIATGLSDVVLAKAIADYEEALRIDHGNAPAHLHLARAHLQSQRYLSVPVKLAHARAFEHLAKGRAIDPGNVTGLHLLADEAFLRTLDYGCARRILETALRLAPDDASTHRLLAELLSGMGEFALAFEHADRAVAVSEGVARRNILLNQGRPRYMAGQYDWVLDHYAKYLAANPGAGLAHFYRSLAFGAKGDVEQALVEAKLAQPQAPAGDAGGIAMLAMAHANAGREKEARELLAELLDRDARGEHVVEYRIAAVYEALGERDAALDWLDREIADRNGLGSWLLWLNQDPAWKALRTDPRFEDIQRRSGW